MTSAYLTLLEATLSHLQDLRESGVALVEVEPATLAALTQPQGLRPPTTSPASASASAVVRPPASPPSRRPGSTSIQRPVATPPSIRPSPPAADLRTPTPAPTPAPCPAPPTAPASTPPTASGIPRAEALEELRSRALVCQLCPHLVRSRTQVVFGVGHPEAELVFVGEAPGADEDRLGEPFVGRAGQLLTRIIGAMGYSRETVYIANVLKCRPDLPPGSKGNRAPRPEEMDTCKPYLMRQLEIIRPKVIVALGATAIQGLLGLRTTLGSIRGRWQQFQGIPVMPTYHPSYLLRAEDAPDRGHSEKRKTWEDMLQVLEHLERPITDRMRGYFLKPPGTGAPAE